MRGPSKAAGIGGAVCSLLVLMYLAVVAAGETADVATVSSCLLQIALGGLEVDG